MREVPEVLFVCVHNAGRSQMAAALLDHHAQGRVHVRSAGSTPADEVNPAAVEAMTELGLDLSQEFPKPLHRRGRRGRRRRHHHGLRRRVPRSTRGSATLDWELADPAGQAARGSSGAGPRDDIDLRVRGLLDELLAPAATA